MRRKICGMVSRRFQKGSRGFDMMCSWRMSSVHQQKAEILLISSALGDRSISTDAFILLTSDK